MPINKHELALNRLVECDVTVVPDSETNTDKLVCLENMLKGTGNKEFTDYVSQAQAVLSEKGNHEFTKQFRMEVYNIVVNQAIQKDEVYMRAFPELGMNLTEADKKTYCQLLNIVEEKQHVDKKEAHDIIGNYTKDAIWWMWQNSNTLQNHYGWKDHAATSEYFGSDSMFGNNTANVMNSDHLKQEPGLFEEEIKAKGIFFRDNVKKERTNRLTHLMQQGLNISIYIYRIFIRILYITLYKENLFPQTEEKNKELFSILKGNTYPSWSEEDITKVRCLWTMIWTHLVASLRSLVGQTQRLVTLIMKMYPTQKSQIKKWEEQEGVLQKQLQKAKTMMNDLIIGRFNLLIESEFKEINFSDFECGDTSKDGIFDVYKTYREVPNFSRVFKSFVNRMNNTKGNILEYATKLHEELCIKKQNLAQLEPEVPGEAAAVSKAESRIRKRRKIIQQAAAPPADAPPNGGLPAAASSSPKKKGKKRNISEISKASSPNDSEGTCLDGGAMPSAASQFMALDKEADQESQNSETNDYDFSDNECNQLTNAKQFANYEQNFEQSQNSDATTDSLVETTDSLAVTEPFNQSPVLIPEGSDDEEEPSPERSAAKPSPEPEPSPEPSPEEPKPKPEEPEESVREKEKIRADIGEIFEEWLGWKEF